MLEFTAFASADASQLYKASISPTAAAFASVDASQLYKASISPTTAAFVSTDASQLYKTHLQKQTVQGAYITIVPHNKEVFIGTLFPYFQIEIP